MPRSDDQKYIDDRLTRALNGQPAIYRWMFTQMDKIAQAVGSSDHHFFHVKGGTSLAVYLQHHGVDTRGFIDQSDWDTQLVLNPTLPPPNWYIGFRKLNDKVEKALLAAQADFSKHVSTQWLTQLANSVVGDAQSRRILQNGQLKLMSQKSALATLACSTLHPLQYLDTAPAALQAFPEDRWDDELENYYAFMSAVIDPDPNYKGKLTASVLLNHTIKDFYLFRLLVNFEAAQMPQGGDPRAYRYRAELIDISVPRRDTVEAMQQWHVTRSRIMNARPRALADVPTVPVPNHFYHLDEQIQMVRENIAESSASSHKRQKRVVRGVHVCSVTREAADLAPLKKDLALLFPNSRGANLLLATPAGRLTTTILDQFCTAYRLRDEAGLRQAFDEAFARDFPRAIASAGSNDAAAFENAMQYCHRLSQVMENHLLERSSVVLNDNRETFLTFVTAMHTAVGVRSAQLAGVEASEAPARLSVGGDLAAHMHLEEGRRKEAEICPAPTIELRVHFETLEDAALLKVIGESLSHYQRSTKVAFKVEPKPPNQILLYWPQPLKLRNVQYYFLYATISMFGKPRAHWPPLSFVRGLPIIAARPLLFEFEERLSRVEEFGVAERLKKVVLGLRRLVTQFW